MGELNVDQQELLREICDNESVILNKYRGIDPPRHHELLELLDQRVEDSPNMFFFAIQNMKYHSALVMLEIFVENENDQCSAILMGKNAEQKNFLQVLITYYSNLPQNGVNLAKQSKSDRHKRDQDEIREVIRRLKEFRAISQLPTSTAENGDTLIVWATKNYMEDVVESLLCCLDRSEQLELIKRKENCTENCGDTKHEETCRNGYNLLMLALDSEKVHHPLIDHMLDIISDCEDEGILLDIALGTNEPGVFSQNQNTIRLAARNSSGNHVKSLLNICVPREKVCDSLMEFGPCGNFALGYLLKNDDMVTIEGLFKPDKDASYRELMRELLTVVEQHPFLQGVKMFEECLEELTERRNVSTNVEDFRQSLKIPGKLKNFLQQSMSRQAIEFFYNVRLFRKNLHIPPFEQYARNQSRPTALLCYNSHFVGKKTLEFVELEMHCIKSALEALNWKDDTIEINGNDWNFDELIKSLEDKIKVEADRCSLFFFCVTSHGSAGQVCGCDGESGKIEKILEKFTTGLPSFIPKVLIFDTCKEEVADADNIEPTLKANNILLLSSTIHGEPAEQLRYLPLLAKEIKAADGKTPFHEMHITAATKVADTTIPEKIAHMEMAGMSICLRKFKSMDFHCQTCKEDIRDCYKDCFICNRCNDWYHLTCLGLTKEHRDLSFQTTFLWYCQACYNRCIDI